MKNVKNLYPQNLKTSPRSYFYKKKMENTPILDSELESGITLSSEAKGFIFEAGRWAQFLAILGFVGAGLLVLIGIVMMAMGGFMGDAFSELGFPPALLGVFYIALAVIYIFPSLYLYQFATKAKAALQRSNTSLLTESLGALKSTFKFYGIMAIVFISIYFLAIIIGVFAGASSFIGG